MHDLIKWKQKLIVPYGSLPLYRHCHHYKSIGLAKVKHIEIPDMASYCFLVYHENNEDCSTDTYINM